MLPSASDVVVFDEAFKPTIIDTEVILNVAWVPVTSAKLVEFVESLGAKFVVVVVCFHFVCLVDYLLIIARPAARVKGVEGTGNRTSPRYI